MILIADSGSTKCTWLSGDGTHAETARTRGINAIHDSPELIGIAALGLDERTAQELLLRHGSVKKALEHFNK